MPDPMDWLLEALDPELHHDVQALAAKAGVSTQEISERLLRLGMVAPELRDCLVAAHFDELWADGLVDEGYSRLPHIAHAEATLAAYDAALKGDPDAHK